MRTVAKVLVGAAVLASGIALTWAQGLNTDGMTKITVNDPPGPSPDQTHVEIRLPDNLKWEGNPNGEQHINLVGDSSKPGLYIQLLKWPAGTGTRPHFHDMDRNVYVISGTWWKGSSSHYDPKLSYPVPAGSFVIDHANEVHFDGVRAGGPPAILEMVGMGPVKTIQVDEDGKPLPARPRPAAGAPAP